MMLRALNFVSINSTSEEVRRCSPFSYFGRRIREFPLIQLPRKSEAEQFDVVLTLNLYGVSINSTSEEVRSVFVSIFNPIVVMFPLIQLPRKSEAAQYPSDLEWGSMFPLIQLPRKSEEALSRIEFIEFLNGFH